MFFYTQGIIIWNMSIVFILIIKDFKNRWKHWVMLIKVIGKVKLIDTASQLLNWLNHRSACTFFYIEGLTLNMINIIPRFLNKFTFSFRLMVVWPPLWPKYAESTLLILVNTILPWKDGFLDTIPFWIPVFFEFYIYHEYLI